MCLHCGKRGNRICRGCAATDHSDVPLPFFDCPACVKRRRELQPEDGIVYIGGAWVWATEPIRGGRDA